MRSARARLIFIFASSSPVEPSVWPTIATDRDLQLRRIGSAISIRCLLDDVSFALLWKKRIVPSGIRLAFLQSVVNDLGAILFAAGLTSAIGSDAAGYIERQGVIFTCLDEIDGENGNRKFDVAARNALNFGVDSFGWDGDGLGAILRDQAANHFGETRVNTFMYKGSSEVHQPNAAFNFNNSNINIVSGRLNKDVFANKKAQNITMFAERVYKTYEAVVHGKYHNPEDLISFCSKSIKPEMLQKMRAESSKLPLKPSDKIRFYTKEELRRGIVVSGSDGHKLKIPSPNILDAAVLSFDKASIISVSNKVKRIPASNKSWGRRR